MSNHPSNVKTVRAQASGMKKSGLSWIAGCIGLVTILAIMVLIVGLTQLNKFTPSQSVVFIREPHEDAPYYIGESIPLRAIARDDEKVKQVELWINDTLISYENSNIPTGLSPFPILSHWTPTQPGIYTISARSTNTKGKQSVSQIQINILESQDSDGDRIADHLDDCPTQAGSEEGMGCMDRDFDGIPDDTDQCLDETGIAEDGCPTPSEDDRDGDGLDDAADVCPDEIGSPTSQGCPDNDGDGLSNAEDACPDTAGYNPDGCPNANDRDYDGIVDTEDACPDSWGTTDLAGCFDSDGDGVLDHEDICPSTAGTLENNGCPDMAGVLPLPPSPDDDDDPPESGGAFDALEPQPKAVVPVEIEAYSLYIMGDYNRLWCYLTVNDNVPIAYEFEAIDRHYWDIAAELSGENSLTVLVDDTQPLSLNLDCVGETSEGADPIGEIPILHSQEEWDGRNQFAQFDSNEIQISYHVCTPSCEETDLVTPILNPVTLGPTGQGPYLIRWQWNGNETNIDGFRLLQIRQYDSPSLYPEIQPEDRSVNIEDFKPACEETLNLALVAYKEDEEGNRVYSRKSNIQQWVSTYCTHTAMVTFQFFDLHSPPADEDGQTIVGPLSGFFYVANGSNIDELTFDAVWVSNWNHLHDGLKLGQGVYRIQDIFDWVHQARADCSRPSCHASDFWASYEDYIIVRLDERDDLIVGGGVYDDDTGENLTDTVFEGQTVVNIEDYESPMPQWITIEGEYADLTIIIQFLSDE